MKQVLSNAIRVAVLLSLVVLPMRGMAQLRTVEAGNWSSTTSSSYGGFHCTQRFSYTQSLYPVSLVGTQAGWVRAIQLDNRSTAAVGNWVPQADLELVWSRTGYTIPGDASPLLIVLDEPFHYSGDSTLVLVVSKSAPSTSTNTKFGYTSTTRSGKYYGGTTESYCQYPTASGTNSLYRQNIRLLLTPTATEEVCLPVTGLRSAGSTEYSISARWDFTPGTSYEVGYAELGSGDNSNSISPWSTTVVTDSTYTFASGLDPNTQYWFYIRKFCSSSSEGSPWDSVLLRTTMIPVSLPISLDFEDPDDDSRLAFANSTNAWHIGAPGSYGSGSRGLYISNDNGLTNAYTVSSASGYSWAWMDVEITDAGSYGISFDWRAYGESTWDYLRVMLVPVSVTFDPAYAANPASNTFLAANSPAGWINLSTTPDGQKKLNLNASWSHFSGDVTLDESQTGIYHLTIIWANDNGSGTQPPAALDNFEFFASTCAAPTACTIDTASLTTTSATLEVEHVEGLTDFVINYRPTGGTAFETASTATGSFTLTELIPGTQYECYIYTICGGDTSAALYYTFVSPCGTLQLPVTLDAEHAWAGTASAPDIPCWAFVNAGNTTYNWRTGNTAANAHSGSYYYYYYGTTTLAPANGWDDWMMTPVIDFTGNEEMTLWVRTSTATTTDTYHGTFAIYATEDGSALSTDTADYYRLTLGGEVTDNLIDFAGNTWQFVTVRLPQDLSGEHRLAFVVKEHSYTFYIDDITIYTRSSCPTVYDVHAAGALMGSDEATVVWADSAYSGNYTATCWPEGAGSGDTLTLTVYDTAATFSGLTPNTVYYVTVRSHCASDDANASYPVSFRTQCSEIPTASLPFVETFESYSSGAANPISPCWNKGTNASTAYPYPSSTAAINGGIGLYMYGINSSTAAQYSWAALPAFEADINTLQMSFKTKKHSTNSNTTSYYGLQVVVGVMADPSDISTLDTVAIIDRMHDEAGSIDSHYVSFERYAGTGGYIAIYTPSVPRGTFSTLYNYAYVDDVVVDLLPACRKPLDLAVTAVGTDEVTLEWTGAEGNFEVEYDTVITFANASISTVTTSDTTVTVTNLLPNTDYWFRVRSDCSGAYSDWTGPVKARTLVSCDSDFELTTDTLARGNTTSYSYIVGTYSSYPFQKNWHIYTIDDLAGMGFVDTMNYIHSISYESGLTTLRTPVPFRIYMAETDLDEWPSTGTSTTGVYDTIPIDSMTLVYNGQYAFTPFSWNDIHLDTPFQYSGNHNLVVAVVRDETFASGKYVYFKYGAALDRYAMVYQYKASATASATTYRYKYGPNTIFNACKHVPDCSRPTNVTLTGLNDNSFSLEWVGNGGMYEIVVTGTSVNPDSVDPGQIAFTDQVGGNSITVGQLDAQHTYYYYLRSLCGSEASDWTVEASITTPCLPQPLPYRENFDSYTAGTTAAAGQFLDPCWNKGTTSTTAYPYLYTSNRYSSPNAMYFAGTTSAYSYAALPLMADSVHNLNLAFMNRKTSASHGPLHIGIMTDPRDISTFRLYRYAGASTANVWERLEVDFSGYTGPEGCIAFLLPDSVTSYSIVDDIEVLRLPDCRRPQNVVLSDITATGVTVTWTDPENTGNYVVCCTSLEDGTEFLAEVSNTTYNFTNLQPGTDYDIKVLSACSSGDSSLWTIPVRLTTLCGARQLPIFIDFEREATGSGTAIVRNPCWSIVNNATSATYRTYPYIYSASANAHSGSNVLYYYMSTSASYASDLAFVGPEIDTVAHPMNTLEVSFWAKRSTNRSSVIVGGMSDNTDIATFVAVDTILLTTTMTQYSVGFDNFDAPGSKYVAFRAVRDTNATLYVYLDDILISPLPPCPRSTDLTVEAVTATTARLAWSDANPVTQWKLEVSCPSAGTVDTLTVTANPYTLTSLTPATGYSFRVAPVCADGTESDFSRTSQLFATTQIPATVPYSYDFEDAAEWANWQTSSSSTANWYRGNVARDNATYAMYISTDGGTTHSWNMNLRTNAVAYRDIDFGTDTASYKMEFDAYLGGSTDGNYEGISVIVADPAAPVVSQDVNITSPWGNVNDVAVMTMRHDTLWGRYAAYLDGMSGVKRIAIYHFNQATAASHPYEDNPSAVDNITIDRQLCDRPYGLTVGTVTDNTADITWSGDATGIYVVDYRPVGTTGTDLFDTVTGLSHTITGLPATMSYNVWVKRLCNDSTASGWSANETFTTLCGAVSVTDTLREDFESIAGVAYNSAGSLPDCWQGYHTGSNAYTPHVTSGSTYSYSINGTKAVTLSANNSTSGTPTYGNAYLGLPNIAEPTNTLTMAFWFCSDNATSGTLYVGYLNGQDPETGFVALKTIPVSSLTVHSGNGLQTGHGIRDTVRFDSVPDGNYIIGFKWVSPSTTLCSASLDDISVWSSYVPQTCDVPTVAVSDVTYQSATVTASGSAPAYQLSYGYSADALTETLTADSTGVFLLTGLDMDTTYHLAVRALCGANSISQWATASFATSMQPCAAPTAVTAGSIGFTSATVSWTGNADGSTWQISVSGANGDSLYTVTANPYTLAGLSADEEYTVKVRTLCSETVMSPWSDEHTFSTTRCDAVAGVAVGDVTDNGATVSWAASGNSNGTYQIEYGPLGFAQGSGTRRTVTATSYAIVGLMDQTSYSVYVRSMCADGVYSAWSAVQTFTTLESDPEVTYYTVTVNYDATMGTVDGGGRIAEGTVITLTATSNPGYRFVEWAEDHVTDSVRTVTVTGDLTFTALFASTVGIDVADLSAVNLYPNPATATVTLSGLTGREQVALVDLNGRTCGQWPVADSQLTIDLTGYARGTYFVRITGDNATAVRKLIVR